MSAPVGMTPLVKLTQKTSTMNTIKKSPVQRAACTFLAFLSASVLFAAPVLADEIESRAHGPGSGNYLQDSSDYSNNSYDDANYQNDLSTPQNYDNSSYNNQNNMNGSSANSDYNQENYNDSGCHQGSYNSSNYKGQAGSNTSSYNSAVAPGSSSGMSTSANVNQEYPND